MKAKYLYFLLLASLALLLLGFAGVAYGTNKLLGGEAGKLSKLRADSQTLSELQTTLSKNKQDIAKYSDLNKIAETVVPQDKDQAEAVREIVNIAAQSGFSPSAITFPSSTLGTAAPGIKSGGLTQLLPVVGMNGVLSLQITVTQDPSNPIRYDQFISFLQKLEQNRRTAQVASINISPDPATPSLVSFALIMNEYIKP